MSEIKVGDRVRGTINHLDGIVVTAEDMVLVHWDGDKAGTAYYTPKDNLTRIESAVPQRKLLPPVKRQAHDFCPPLTLEKLNARINALELDVSGMRSYLEAIPAVCPTCGKVADYRHPKGD